MATPLGSPAPLLLAAAALLAGCGGPTCREAVGALLAEDPGRRYGAFGVRADQVQETYLECAGEGTAYRLSDRAFVPLEAERQACAGRRCVWCELALDRAAGRSPTGDAPPWLLCGARNFGPRELSWQAYPLEFTRRVAGGWSVQFGPPSQLDGVLAARPGAPPEPHRH